jgi:predicted nucleotide-binding protein/CheY-like chemotaxis protein
MLPRRTVLLIDDEPASAELISKALMSESPDMKLASSTMRPLADYYQCIALIVEPDPLETLTERAIGAVRRTAVEPAVIMVDLSFDRLNRAGAVENGRALAMALRSHFTRAAVGVYTKHGLDPIQYARIGSDGFAFLFPEILKMTQGPKRLLGDDWYSLLNNLVDSERKTMTAAPVVPSGSTMPSGPPRIFVASSSEQKEVAIMLARSLNDNFEAVPWSMQPSAAPNDFISSFLKNVAAFNCGVFVFAPDDEVNLRQQTFTAVRDNVVLELGVFLGRFGRDRAFIVEPDDALAMRHLSDLQGYTAIRYRRATWDEGHREMAMARVASELYSVLTRRT